MSHSKTELADCSAVNPEIELPEPTISVGANIPGMEAAARLATEIFTSLTFGLMVVPMELPMAMGFGAFQAIKWTARDDSKQSH